MVSSTLKTSGKKRKVLQHVEQNGQFAGNQTHSLESISSHFDQLCSSYDQFLVADQKKAVGYCQLTKSLYERMQDGLKDFGLVLDAKSHSQKPLKKLFVEGFDNEQIWQQLEIFNRPFIEQLVSETSGISARKNRLTLGVNTKPQAKPDASSKSILKKSSDDVEKKDSAKKVQFAKEIKEKVVNKKLDKDESTTDTLKKKVDFFDHNQMEAFLDAEDRREMANGQDIANEDEEEVDYFAEMSSDSEDEDEEETGEGKRAMYDDFFDPPTQHQGEGEVDNEDGSEDDEDDQWQDEDSELDTRDVDDEDLHEQEGDEQFMLNVASSSDEEGHQEYDLVNEKLRAMANENAEDEDDAGKSEFEQSQTALRKKIAKAEEELLLPHNRRWQLAGEVTSDARPENSLLEEHLQFDHVSRPAPLITDETTFNLEALIKQRIKDKVFDDVERKEKPNEKPFEFRRRIMLESEKSKVGLAEVYEQEYVKQQQKLKEQQESSSLKSLAATGEVEESEARQEVRKMMRALFRQLDALSAFHYTPRPPEPEVKVINNLPAISVEEVTPDTVSDMKLLAPEEVFSTRGKMVLQAKGERSATDMKRSRRLKKKKQANKQKFLEQKAKVDSTRVNKADMEKLNKKTKKGSALLEGQSGPGKKALSSSTKFFERLQEQKEVGKVHKRPKPKLAKDANLSKKLKL